MLGALIGDIVGSPYEWKNLKSKNFPLFRRTSCMTDDSVLTAAVASALLLGGWKEDLEHFKTDLVGELRRLGHHYLGFAFGPRFERWLLSDAPSPTTATAMAARSGSPRWPGWRRACRSVWLWRKPPPR